MRILILSLLMAQTVWAMAQNKHWEFRMTSPDKKVVVNFTQKAFTENGMTVEKPVYSIALNGKEAIRPSLLGLVRDDQTFTGNLELVNDFGLTKIWISAQMVSGKKSEANEQFAEHVFRFRNQNQALMDIIFRVANDGVAFRYSFPEKNDKDYEMLGEATSFAIPEKGKGFIHPYDMNSRKKPSYEIYAECDIPVGTKSPNPAGWAYPMLFQLKGCWMMITEAVLDGTYCATHTQINPDKSYRVVFPEKEEAVIPDDPEPVFRTPWVSPWRVIMLSESLAGIVESNLVQCLNPPTRVNDASWVKPGRSSWSWWSDGGSPRSYEKQIKYVDFSAQMGWEYMLIDAGWPEMKGGTVEDVVKYANNKGVGVWLWYHSGAGVPRDSITYRNVLSDPEGRKKEFGKLEKWGVKGLKVDFFDTDKQGVVKLYYEILKDAADHHLMINFHGATLPRGMEHTWPNLMTMEAIRGAEGFGQQPRCDQAAWHHTVIPFTRNVVGSMDYTPVTFSNKIRQGVEAFRRTTMTHQLALAVIFESGIQNFADKAEAYLSLPEKPLQFMKTVPVAWDETRLLAGYPGDFVVMARRSGKTWYLAGINGKAEVRIITFALPPGIRLAKLECITDGADLNSFGYDTISCDSKGKVSIPMAGNGGFVAVIN